MPSFNQANYIAEAVRSVLAQDDPDWELWIVDNSTDNTPEVVAEFADPRIQFRHVPERMDPGTCLNWMLDRAVARDFSYVHTDNNLGTSYVRKLRAALADHPLGLAYCDMRIIDDAGRYSSVFRRGEFDLPRLLSVDVLGVPFAATTKLAKRMGGFAAHDFADDVRFCVSAYGLAHYVYVREPLMDYRLHSNSRTQAAGGSQQMIRIFAHLIPKVVPLLEQRGLQPVRELEQAIRSDLDDLDLFVEHHWHRKLSKMAPAWWRGPVRIDDFFFAGLLDVPGFSSRLGRPPRRLFIRDEAGRLRVMPWTRRTLRRYLKSRRQELHELSTRARNKLLAWACTKIGDGAGGEVTFRIKKLDFRTLWAARQLEIALGWKPLLDPAIAAAPEWLDWGAATGSEPLLDCSGEISFSPAIVHVRYIAGRDAHARSLRSLPNQGRATPN